MVRVVIVSLVLLLTGCSPEETPKDHQNAKVSPKASKGSKKRRQPANPLTKELLNGRREIVSGERNPLNFDQILSADGVATMLNRAKSYFGDLSFQHLVGDYRENQGAREALFAKALNAFFTDIEDHVFDDLDIETPTIPKGVKYYGDRYRSWEILSVMAVAMSTIHETQLAAAKESGETALSILDLIQEAITRRELEERSEKQPEYVLVVLRNQAVAEYLLQLRHNFYAYILAAKLSSFEEAVWTRLKMRFLNWSVNIDNFNQAQLGELSDLMYKAIETRGFMDKQKIALRFNQSARKIFANLRWETINIKNFDSLVEQMGMNPVNVNEHQKFMKSLGVRPKVRTPQERLVVDVNQVTGASLFIFDQKSLNQTKPNKDPLAIPTDGEGDRMSNMQAP